MRDIPRMILEHVFALVFVAGLSVGGMWVFSSGVWRPCTQVERPNELEGGNIEVSFSYKMLYVLCCVVPLLVPFVVRRARYASLLFTSLFVMCATIWFGVLALAPSIAQDNLLAPTTNSVVGNIMGVIIPVLAHLILLDESRWRNIPASDPLRIRNGIKRGVITDQVFVPIAQITTTVWIVLYAYHHTPYHAMCASIGKDAPVWWYVLVIFCWSLAAGSVGIILRWGPYARRKARALPSLWPLFFVVRDALVDPYYESPTDGHDRTSNRHTHVRATNNSPFPHRERSDALPFVTSMDRHHAQRVYMHGEEKNTQRSGFAAFQEGGRVIHVSLAIALAISTGSAWWPLVFAQIFALLSALRIRIFPATLIIPALEFIARLIFYRRAHDSILDVEAGRRQPIAQSSAMNPSLATTMACDITGTVQTGTMMRDEETHSHTPPFTDDDTESEETLNDILQGR